MDAVPGSLLTKASVLPGCGPEASLIPSDMGLSTEYLTAGELASSENKEERARKRASKSVFAT